MFVVRRSCTLLLRNSNRFCENFVPAAAVAKPFQISNQFISISSKVSKNKSMTITWGNVVFLFVTDFSVLTLFCRDKLMNQNIVRWNIHTSLLSSVCFLCLFWPAFRTVRSGIFHRRFFLISKFCIFDRHSFCVGPKHCRLFLFFRIVSLWLNDIN